MKRTLQTIRNSIARTLGIGFSLLVIGVGLANAQTTYYSKAAATDFNNVASWGANTDGSGASPASISNIDNFVVQNASALSLTASANVRQLTISSGSLTIAANTLNVAIAAAFNSTLNITGGTLTVTGGTLNVNGNMILASGATFNQSGGNINVDGNNAGSATGSVASGTIIVNWTIATAANLNLTGGTFTIVDPHYTTTNTFQPTYTPVGSVAASTNHTFKFGDGVSTDNGGTNGFFYYSWNGSGIFKFGNLVLEPVVGGTNRFVLINGTYFNVAVMGDLTINNGAELRNSGAASTATNRTIIRGNVTVNAGGIFTNTADVYFGDVTSTSATVLAYSASPNAQTIGGTGTFKNAITGQTANFATVFINNTNNSGVTFASTQSLLSGTNTGTVSNILNFVNGVVSTSSNNFILGISGTTVGTLTYAAGGFGTGSSFGRWFGTAGSGTTIAASTIPTVGAGSFPFVTGTATAGFSANHFHRATAALTAAGIFTVAYNGTTGLTVMGSPVSESTLTFDNATNATWTVSTVSGYASSAAHSFAIQGQNTYPAFSTNARLLIAGALVGTHQAGTAQPMVQRTAVPAVNISGAYQIGMIGSELPNRSVTSGPWDNAATWSLGVPTCAQNVVINAADSIWITGSMATANAIAVVINGKLGISGSTLNAGCTNNNNLISVIGKLYVSGGTVNINGSLNAPAGSQFWHTGGNINIDGNAAGVLANSVADGTPIVSIATGSIKLSGGVMTIVDPHAGVTSASANRAFYYTGTTAIDTTFGWTLKFGDGVSADAGGAVATPVGFVVDMAGSKIVIDSLVINAGISGTNRFVTLNNSTTLGCNTMNITSNGEVRISSATYIAGNLTNNGTLTNTAGAVTFGTFLTSTVGTSSRAQVISGTGVFRNLTASPTANFTTLTINNNNTAGVTFASAQSLLSGTNTGTVSGTLTITNGIINTGVNAFILGISAATNGTLTYTNGGFGAGSTFSRWWGTAVAGQTITAATVPTAGIGTYPFVTVQTTVPSLTFNSRTAYIRQAVAATTGGTIAVKYNNGTGFSAVSIADGAYTVDNLSNANWQVVNTGITGTPTYTIALGATNLYQGYNGNGRISLASAAMSGTHQAGTTLPLSQRAGVSLTDMSGTWYMGVNGSDVAFSSITSGNWETGSTWNKGIAPGCADSVVIDNGHTVTIGGAAANARAISVNTTGTLNITGNTTTVGCTMNNSSIRVSGKLSVTGGTLNVNGAFINNPSGRIHHLGGDIIVDGNDSGKTATSATGHLVDMYATTDTSVVFTGGIFTIVDPAVAAAGVSFKIFPSQPVNFGTGHTLRFGNGVSNQPAGALAFNINLFNSGTGLASLGNVIVNTPWGTNRFVNSTNTVGILGNLTITAGNYRMTSAHTVKGNITNSDTLVNTSTLTLADPTNAITSNNTVAQSITGTGKFLNAATGATAGTTSLAIRNSSTGGVTIGVKLSVSGTLTLTRGIVNTNATDTFQLGTATAAGTLSGGADTAYINGPFSRTFAASRTASGTYTVATLYPVGKNGRYLPLWIDPTTNAGGSTVLSGEAFTTNTGSLGGGVTSMSAVRWASLIGAGGANFVSTNLRLTDTSALLLPSSKILSAPAAAGAYVGIVPTITYAAGPPKTLTTTGTQILAAAFSGYFNYGEVIPCATPANQPTSFITSNMGGTSFDASFTAALSLPSHYLVVRYASGATPVAPSVNTAYAVNASLGTGTVVANMTGTAFSQTGLTVNTTYDYYVYAYNNSGCFGPVYNVTSPLISSVTTCAASVTVPTIASAVDILAAGFTGRWTKIAAPGATYKVDVSANSGFTSFVAGYNGFSTGVDSFFVISGLNPATIYYYRVRAVDGTCISTFSGNQTVTTACNPVTVLPYVEDFNASTAIPPCAAVLDVANDDGDWTVIAAPTDGGTGYTGNVLRYDWSVPNPGDDWFFTAPLSLVGGVTYSLKYSYGNNSTTYVEKLRVKLGNNANPAGMTITVSDHPSVAGAVRNVATVTVTPATTGVYYLGFQAYSAADQFNLYLDDITLSEIVLPTVLSTSATSVLQNSATLGGNVTSAGNGVISASGVVIGTSVNPVIGGPGVVDSVRTPAIQSGLYSFNVTGLTGATLYHYRAYAINSAGTKYGGDSTFTTLAAPVLPVVTKSAATNVQAFSVTLNGNVVSNGGVTITASGIVYSTTNNPIIGGPGVVDSVTNPLVQLGAFAINPKGLVANTKYYFKAYAINSVGTAYSVLDSFTTAFVITSLPYTQNFESGANSWTTAATGGGNNWVLGTPAKTGLSGAYSGSQAWVTKLSANYDDNHNAAIVSPQMDLTSVTNPVLRFYHKFSVEANYDALVVEISTNGGAWVRLDSTLGAGSNFNTTGSYAWYNSSSTNGAANTAPLKFSSSVSYTVPTNYVSNDNGWIQSATALTGAAGQNNVKVRFRFGSDGSGNGDGWAIDDIEIVDVATPTTQASAVNLTNIGFNNTTVNWTNGNGQGRLVVARLTTSPAIAPANNKLYNPNTVFGTADSTGLGNYIVYKSNGTSTVTTGLALLTNYTYDVYEYNGKYMHVRFTAAASNSGTTLPVTLSSFEGTAKGGNALLTWTTLSEINNLGFDVERSVDGKSFEKAGFVKGAGNSNQELSYSMIDGDAFAKAGVNTLYYRLKQLDVNGRYEYSNVVVVSSEAENANGLSVFPNPFSNEYTVSFSAKTETSATIEMLDIQGKLVNTQFSDVSKGYNTITIDNISRLQTGIYFVKVTIGSETKVMKLIKE